MFIRLFLIATLLPLQACSNTKIGEKLENSFDVIENPQISKKTPKIKVKNKLTEIKKIRSNDKDSDQENGDFQLAKTNKNSLTNKDRYSQVSTKSKKKVIYKPQPYRIILKLSGANPSAPAETVTEALRKAGVEFEVEKIERFDEKILFKDSSLKRKEF